MKTIGFIAAMKEEISAFLANFESIQNEVHNEVEFHVVQQGNTRIVAAESGVGKVNAAMTTTIMITNYHPSFVVNVGVAGGFQTDQHILDMVIADSFVYTDVDTTHFESLVIGQLLGEPPFYETTPSLIQLIREMEAEHLIPVQVHYGRIGSGDQFIARKDQVERIQKLFPEVLCVEMEGAAIAHVCHRLKTAILSIRSLSDIAVVEHDNTVDFVQFLEKASKQAADMSLLLIKKIGSGMM